MVGNIFEFRNLSMFTAYRKSLKNCWLTNEVDFRIIEKSSNLNVEFTFIKKACFLFISFENLD